MNKIIFILSLMFACTTIGYSQVSAYTFSQSNGTYTPITGGTVYGNTSSDDQRFVDPAVPLGGATATGVGLPIGFNFVFNTEVYDRLAINTNGWISLGSSLLNPAVNIISSSNFSPLSSTQPTSPAHLRNRIAGFATDLQGQIGSEIRLETIGTAPNRICVVQFTNMRRYNEAGHNLTFQIQLHETTNQVIIVYGTMTFNNNTYRAQVGLGGNLSTDFNNRTTDTNWNSTSAGTANGSSCIFDTTVIPPVNGLTFVWTPPTCPWPKDIVISNITTNSANFSWSAGGTESEWECLILPAGSPTPTVAGNYFNVNNFELSALNPGTSYAFWVRAYCSSSDKSYWRGPFNFTTSCPIADVPYSEDFESATVPNLPACTSQENVGLGNLWTVVNNPGNGFTTNVLRYAWSDGAANVWFFTNGVNLVGGTTYRISYDYRGTNSGGFPERLRVSYGSSASAAGMTNSLADHPNIVDTTPTNNSVTFTPATSGVYYFGFNAYSAANQGALFVDNIEVDFALSSPSFDNDSFFAHPNPVKDVLNLSYTSEISTVRVMNMLGQEVISRNLNTTNAQIDMSQLSAGTYIVNATIGDTVKTIKVVKQ